MRMLIIINTIKKQMKKMNRKTEPFQITKNEDYLNFILKNHMLIEDKNNNNFRKIINAKIFDDNNKTKITYDKGGFTHHQSKLLIGQMEKGLVSKQQSDGKQITYDMLMEIMQIKNQQIAQQLLKERKSMGDIIYRYQKSSKSLDNRVSIKSRNFTERKSGQISKEHIIKFPQLIKRKIVKNSENIFKTPEKYNNNQNQKNITKQQKQQKIISQKEQNIKEEGNYKDKNIKDNMNLKLLKAYYKNQSFISIKKQQFQPIPQFKPPKYPPKKELSKIKCKSHLKKQINKNDPNSSIFKELTDYLETNIKSIEFKRQNIIQRIGNKSLLQGQQEQIKNCQQESSQGKRNTCSQILDNDKNLGQREQKQKQKQKQIELMLGLDDERQKNEQDEEINIKMKKHHSQQMSKVKSKKSIILFEKENKDQNIYQIKIKYYRQFLFLINFSHRKFDPLILKEESLQYKSQAKYKYYIGKGNNSLLIKSLLKRRFWWVIEEDPKKANFIWSQLKMSHFYQYQPKSYIQNPFDKLEQEESILKKKKKKNKDLKQKIGMFKAPLPLNNQKILTSIDQKYYQDLISNVDSQKISNYNNRLKYLPPNFLSPTESDKSEIRVHNHFQHNYFIGNKKALFYNLKQYYQLLGKNVFSIIPLTFHIKTGVNDPQYQKFIKEYNKIKNSDKNKVHVKNIWIVKPGQLSNRGTGITVIDQLYELNNIIRKKQKHSNGTQKTYIIQRYIERPMLYNRRKFDIRHYMMVSRLHGRMKAYWYAQGYIRTSSYQFSLEEIDNQFMHLTNDAIQKNAYSYGKFQQANKVSYNEFQRYLDTTFPEKKLSFAQKIYPKMKQIALDAFKATYMKIDPNSYEHNFEVFGLDFMIDNNFQVWLIQVNTNPCLEINCPILNRIIPTMLEHTLRLTLDVIYPPTAQYPNSQKYLAPDNPLERLQFQLIFDQGRDGLQITRLYENVKEIQLNNIEEQDEVYENDGRQLQLQGEIG